MDELIEKALEIKKDENDELRQLLEESGFVTADSLVTLINETQEVVDDVLQDDLEELLVFVSQLHVDYSKSPSNRKLNRMLKKRKFVDNFKDNVSPTLRNGLDVTGKEFAKVYGTDFSYDDLTKRTRKEFENWLKELPKVMKLSTDSEVSKLIKQSFEQGKGVKWLKKKLSESYEFSYKRARVTAITELLTMESYGAYENIMQSKSVTHARWRHSFGVKEPRVNHQDLDGVEIEKGTEFDLGGHTCLYPRQPKLPASERVHCHCWLEPVVNKEYTDDDDDYYEEED